MSKEYIEREITKTEIVHGKWEDGCAVDSKGNIVYKSIDCSECFNIFKIKDHDAEYWKNKFKHCPFCGAIMDGVINNETLD